MEQSSHWDLYWQYNRSGNSFTSPAGGGASEMSDASMIASFWSDHFKTFPKRADIIDIATGNGALVAFAANYAKEKSLDWRVSGIDKARINPVISDNPRVKFHPETDMTSLPFESSSVDVVCSQFGFEYGERGRTIGEILRVMKPDGKFIAMIHATDSIITKNSRATIEIIGALEAGGIFACITRLNDYLNFTEFQQDLLHKLKALHLRYQGTSGELEIFEVMRQLGAIITRVNEKGLMRTSETLTHFVQQQIGHQLRLKEQVSVAFGYEDLMSFASELAAMDVQLSYLPVLVESNLYAWQVVIDKVVVQGK